MNIPRGFSGYFCIGRVYGGFRIEIVKGFFYRVCLGWVAFGFILYDLEQLIAHGAKLIGDEEKNKEDKENGSI